MAWQLIYTSAEHGLSAGRSGFCTVARHAAIRERLVGELERISAYERPSGGQPLPVIYSHRILPLGGDTYHILSCIQDAGPDYSGRTNHIAHHLVCEERELGPAPSPATVLRTFAWRKRWNEPARYFSDSETIDLSQYHFTVPGNAWKELSGNPAHARLLADGPARSGCTLAFAPGHEEHFLRLINESLGRLDVTSDRAETLWQVPFTTYLQSGDNERDFLWRGCWSGSLAHRSAVGSGLLSFDLTRPGTLPAPPPLPVVRATVEKASSPPKATAVAMSAGGRSPQRGRPTVVAVADVKSPSWPLRWLLPAGIAVVVLGLLIGGGWAWLERRAVQSNHPQSHPTPTNLVTSTTRSTTNTFPSGTISQTNNISISHETNALVSAQPVTTGVVIEVTSRSITNTLPVRLQPKVDLLPEVPTYLVRANEGKIDIHQLLAKQGLTRPTDCQLAVTNAAFGEFPSFGGGVTNKWEGEILRQGTKTLFYFDKNTTLRRAGTNLTTAAIHFTCAEPFNLLYFESDRPWQRPVTLSMANLHSGIDAGFADYSLAEGLRDHLKQLLPDSEQRTIIFRLQSTWLTNIRVEYQRPALYTNTLSNPSAFAQRFSPRATGEALSAETNNLFRAKVEALQNAARDARPNNILLKGNWLTAGDKLLVATWGCTAHTGDRSFSEFLKQSDSTKDDSYNPSWSDYCQYLKTLLERLKQQRFPEPTDEKNKKKYIDEVLPKWSDVLQMIQSATNTQEAVAIVEERLPEKLGELPLKCNTGWVTQFGKGQLKAAFVELKKTSTKEVAAKYDNNISMITEQLKSLPKVGEPWGAIWLEVQVYGTNWWPLIEFKYEENRK